MNYNLSNIPNRPVKPRETGLTMVIDKGLGVREAADMAEMGSSCIDFVKFGFGTSLLTNKLKEKLDIYRQNGIIPYFGGTLFELFVIRNDFDGYRKFVDSCKLTHVEVSDGSYEMPQEDKLKYIETLAKDFTVLSEVGSKKADVVYTMEEWVKMMKDELAAGSWKVIAEAREAGNIGIYNSDGSANKGLINGIIKEIDINKILWEAPQKQQQVMFIKLIGPNVSLGNIATADILSLETLRLGLRGDTFFDYLPK